MSENQPNTTAIFNPISWVVIVLTAAIVGVEVVLQLGERGIIGGVQGATWRIYLLRNFAFHDAVFEHILLNRRVEFATLWPFLTYPFLHLSIGHVAVGATIFLAMGKTISEKFSNMAVVVLFVGCSVVGALVFGIFSNQSFPLVGAYPAVYGFISAYTWIEYTRLKALGKSTWPAFQLIVMLLVIRTIFAVFFGLRNSWTADFSGLVTGFLLSFVLAPDGRERVRGWIAAIRNRG